MILSAALALVALQLAARVVDVFLHDSHDLVLQPAVGAAAEKRAEQKLLAQHVVKHLFEHWAQRKLRLLRLKFRNCLLELLNQLVFNLVAQVIGIGVVEIERAAVEVCTVCDFLYRDVLKLFLVHDFRQRLTQQPFGSADSAVFLLCCHFSVLP